MMPFIHILKRSEEGYAMMVTILVLFMLTIIGLAATTTSTIEVQIAGNTKKIAENFYDAEGAMIDTIETTDLWLTDTFLVDGEGAAKWSKDVDFDGAAGDDATVEIRCITTETDTDGDPIVISGLSTTANDLPVDRHVTVPPANSGFDLAHFYIRKYGVTSTALRGGAPLQTGVWKAFSKNL
jgi:Tfp pilus assembly protein PilX